MKQSAQTSLYVTCIVAICLALVNSALADTVYIRDTLYVPLRGGQSGEHRILHNGLRSGMALERLEINSDTGYTRVKTSTGLEGWLQTQYLVDEPIAISVLSETQAQLEQLKGAHQQTLSLLHEANDAVATLEAAESTTHEQTNLLAGELQSVTELAADVIAINEKNDSLVRQTKALNEQIDELSALNAGLLSDRTREWFLLGAGTVFIGLLFGFWIARRIYNRRNSSGWA